MNDDDDDDDDDCTPEEEEEDLTEDLDLEVCPQCDEIAWDGYICHSCGMKDI